MPKEETISDYARMDAIFIKYNEKTQNWHDGIKANSKKLKTIVDKLRENVDTFKF